MSASFALGSLCFFVGPFPGYVNLVGATADALTFFIGSVLFTVGGGLQTWLAAPDRGTSRPARAAWWTAVIQSAGTIFFNFSTLRAIQTAVGTPGYNRLVWRPDAFGSVCFLVSGLIAYHASPRRGWWPVRGPAGWWQPAINFLGCLFFGVSAVAGFVVPSTGTTIDLAAANWNTAAGAACFLACAIAGLRTSPALVPAEP